MTTPEAPATGSPESETAITGERVHVARLQPYLDERPRSVVRAGAYLLLDGQWRFERDDADCGLSEHWYTGHDYARTAHWPGSVKPAVEGGAPATDAGSGEAADSVIVWFERDFTVPEEWHEGGHPVLLTFGACGYETRVWLNGTLLDTIEGEDVHVGEYTSFSYELPDELLEPVNRLTVRVTDSLDPDRPRGKQESHVYKRGGIWYQAISGPVRSVWIEPVEPNRLRSRLSVVSNVTERLVEFGVTTRVRDAGPYRLRLVVAALDDENPCAMRDIELGSSRVSDGSSSSSTSPTPGSGRRRYPRCIGSSPSCADRTSGCPRSRPGSASASSPREAGPCTSTASRSISMASSTSRARRLSTRCGAR